MIGVVRCREGLAATRIVLESGKALPIMQALGGTVQGREADWTSDDIPSSAVEEGG